MQTGQRSLGQRLVTALTRLLVTVVVLGLLGLVGYLVSERNARTYTLAVEGDRLVVMKGKMLPVGEELWQPGDPRLAETYAPVVLDGFRPDPQLLSERHTDRDELDRALFEVLLGIARPRVSSNNPASVEQGIAALHRAEKLTGITDEQRAALKKLEGDVALYQARQRLADARKALSDALSQLEVAAGGHGPGSHDAEELAKGVGVAARALEAALRGSPPSTEGPPPESSTQAVAPAPKGHAPNDVDAGDTRGGGDGPE